MQCTSSWVTLYTLSSAAYWILIQFPGGSEVKVSASNVGDPGSIPGSGRSPGEGNGNPLQYSCLENPMDGEAWQAAAHGVAKSRTRLSTSLSLHRSRNKEMLWERFLREQHHLAWYNCLRKGHCSFLRQYRVNPLRQVWSSHSHWCWVKRQLLWQRKLIITQSFQYSKL